MSLQRTLHTVKGFTSVSLEFTVLVFGFGLQSVEL